MFKRLCLIPWWRKFEKSQKTVEGMLPSLDVLGKLGKGE